jgi:hypothetical protein
LSKVIEGIKLIRHNAGGVNEPDDPSYPYKLEASFRPPEFMIVAFIGLYKGSEEIVVRGMTQKALEEFISENHLRSHPRLRQLTITGPKGEVLEKIPA